MSKESHFDGVRTLMFSSTRQWTWARCLCLGGVAIAAATWIVYLLLPSTVSKNSYVTRMEFSSQEAPLSSNEFPSRSLYREYESRLNRVRSVCDQYSISYYRTLRKSSSNRIDGRIRHCTTRNCPILVDDDLLIYYCFIPKVASTTIKEFLLNISGTFHRYTPKTNLTAFHLEANELLKRTSPIFYPGFKLRRYYKALFVRHPLDRLVSAFRDKAEKSREEVFYFYDTYWDKMMKKYRQIDHIQSDSKPTFHEFVRYLIDNNPSNYDDHWAPYWSRCEPCLVQYDLIGKLETAADDFHQVSRQLDVPYISSVSRIDSSRKIARSYFSQITAEELSRLYSIYKLDFEIFGYTLDEFFGTPNYKTLLKPTMNEAATSKQQ